ncbi:MAG: NAD(P)-binding domain-containing protein [Gudongella sp.]|jgi:glycerol-3-phosphate dehydrogenase (NAD(P)+)|nr:NAD(P)-binding domain-containing protein [Gudongella sp.]
MKIGVLGGGSWATALAMLLAGKGHDVEIWVRSESQAKEMSISRTNKKYLPDIILPDSINVNVSIDEVVHNKEILLLGVPTNSVREILIKLEGRVDKEQIFVNVAKGIEIGSMKRISEIVGEYFPYNDFVVLSGPSHAEEVSRNIPTTIVSASEKK